MSEYSQINICTTSYMKVKDLLSSLPIDFSVYTPFLYIKLSDEIPINIILSNKISICELPDMSITNICHISTLIPVNIDVYDIIHKYMTQVRNREDVKCAVIYKSNSKNWADIEIDNCYIESYDPSVTVFE